MIETTRPADALKRHWTARAPSWAQGYIQLSRLDRPVGWQLLLMPCLMGLALGRTHQALGASDARYALAFLAGAIAMRGAGCTYNDILDRDIDAKVERTRARPIPAGVVSMKQAWGWLGLQSAIGLVALLQFPPPAMIAALLSLPLVALYPLMKRITWWPQAWLGLCFSWGALVAGPATQGALTPPAALLFTGCVAWVIGYDTVYALQDREDDALIGVRSTARLFGARWRVWTGAFYALALALWIAAALWAGAALWTPTALLAIGALFIAPVLARVRAGDPQSALAGFKANVPIGFLVALAFALGPLWLTLDVAMGSF